MPSKKEQPHGNRKDNPNPHSLYAIYDHSRREIYKFGVAEEEEDSEVPKRVLRQVFSWNRLVGAIRFTFRILKKALPGKAKAYEQEDDAVDAFIEKRGRLPAGNDPHTYHSR